jgi:DNA-binding MarR family transcriptional regulator
MRRSGGFDGGGDVVSAAVLASESLRLDRSVVSRLADALAGRDWVRRERHPQDQRAVHLVLTERGRRAADRVAGAVYERSTA